MEKKFKIKPLTKEQIIISLDRLTRFKPTEEKYLRVFKEIVLSNLIYPKYSKKQLDLMGHEELTSLVENIFNFSLEMLIYPSPNFSDAHSSHRKIPSPARGEGEKDNNFSVNKKLLQYEKSVFNFDKNVEKLLENKIDYNAAIKLFDGGLGNPPYFKNLSLNLRWLKSLLKDENQIKNRANFGLKFPVEKVIIAEGITEEILLPKFARICGVDFDKEGINLISAGGKNQVVKLFYQYAEILKLPIFVLLDKDGEENHQEIMPKLRKNDKVHVIKNGEFEDTLELNLIKRTLNKHFKGHLPLKLEDLRKNLPMTQILEEIFKQRGLEFKKSEFASLLCENILTKKDVSIEIETIIFELKN